MTISFNYIFVNTVCLVARSGEGRRWLSICIECGQFPIEKKSPNPGSLDPPQEESSDENAEMWANLGESCAWEYQLLRVATPA